MGLSIMLVLAAVAWGQTARELEDIFWQEVVCERAREVEAYLKEYPSGTYVAEARACLAAIARRVEAEETLALDRQTIIWVQRGLTALDYPVGVPDGQLGQATRSALWQWQEASGLVATGYLTSAQVDRLTTAGRAEAVRQIEEDTRRQAARIERQQARETEAALDLDRRARIRVQQELMSLDYPVEVADGLFGPTTRLALQNWQRDKGFTATGYLTSEQATALIEAGGQRQAAEEAAQQQAAFEAERRRAEEAERQRATAEAERQRTAEEAERRRAEEAERQRAAVEAERRRAEEAERQRAAAEAERQRAPRKRNGNGQRSKRNDGGRKRRSGNGRRPKRNGSGRPRKRNGNGQRSKRNDGGRKRRSGNGRRPKRNGSGRPRKRNGNGQRSKRNGGGRKRRSGNGRRPKRSGSDRCRKPRGSVRRTSWSTPSGWSSCASRQGHSGWGCQRGERAAAMKDRSIRFASLSRFIWGNTK